MNVKNIVYLNGTDNNGATRIEETTIDKTFTELKAMSDLELEDFLLNLFDVSPDWTELCEEDNETSLDYEYGATIGHILIKSK